MDGERRSLPPTIYLQSSSIHFPNSRTRISYTIADEQYKETGFPLWTAHDEPAKISILTLESESGTGKSTFASDLFDFLRYGAKGSLDFRLNRDTRNSDIRASMMPQKPSIVLHWRVGDLVPPQSQAVSAFFPEIAPAELRGRYFSQLSGGQAARVLALSCFEEILRSARPYNFMVLDEAFEGVGPDHVAAILREVERVWAAKAPNKFLHVLLVTHMDVERATRGLNVRRVHLKSEASVDVPNERVLEKRVVLLAV